MLEKVEFCNNKEYKWWNPCINWENAAVITAGVDVGSVSSQAVIMCDYELFAYSNMRTDADSPNSAINAITCALKDTGLKLNDIHFTVGTGYGRTNVPFADCTITEISCHARGANYIYGPTVRTVLDMGGQDCKAIHIDEKGKVISFIMNDKCAAGTGRGLEVFADFLGVPIEEIGERSLQVDEEPEPVTNTCVVFARTEAIGLLRSGWSIEKVLASYCSAMARRIALLLERIGIEKDFAITGGIAKNIGVVSRLEKELNVKALSTHFDTQIAGALGAALLAGSLVEKGKKKERG